MAYSYSQFTGYNFDPNFLSSIIQMAQARKDKQQQQNAQIIQSALKLANRQGWLSGGATGPTPIAYVPTAAPQTPDPTMGSADLMSSDPISLELQNYQPTYGFARGGVVPSWTDPNDNLQAAQEYTRQLSLPSVESAIVAGLRRQEFQQQMNQQNMKDALNAATKYLQDQRTAAIGQALINNSPDLANDPRTQAMIAAGGNPYQVAQYVGQQQADEADAQRQATNDWYNQQRINKELYGSGASDQTPATSPQTTFDAYGREWRQGSGDHWYLIPKNQSAAQQIPTYDQQTVVVGDNPEPSNPSDNNTGKTPPVTRQDTSNPPAATGIAPSRDEADIGGYYRAPDGTIRKRTS